MQVDGYNFPSKPKSNINTNTNTIKFLRAVGAAIILNPLLTACPSQRSQNPAVAQLSGNTAQAPTTEVVPANSAVIANLYSRNSNFSSPIIAPAGIYNSVAPTNQQSQPVIQQTQPDNTNPPRQSGFRRLLSRVNRAWKNRDSAVATLPPTQTSPSVASKATPIVPSSGSDLFSNPQVLTIRDGKKDPFTKEEQQAIISGSQKLGITPEIFVSVINAESGLDPKSDNGSYAGYCQLGDENTEEIGLPGGRTAYRDMPILDQINTCATSLDYRIKNISQMGSIPNDDHKVGNYYAHFLAPGYANRGWDEPLYSAGDPRYEGNAAIDTKFGNNDGNITKSDLAAFITKKGAEIGIDVNKK